ncbi:hypothetical protein CAPTEDRAFT_228976 [Capitella teleta]|uniref:Uncharacterized protein n=1 Tax=Capitella teleta TaxID=283909 RepID=R7V9E8_CAPTE|nr:hypothetical protein CAPTEDRAFT_228976 [Capitella teleta]|eukprot:ELU12370.1 hypothetical protein CAPTEDRAFT_228976 [Capitella teleta]
MIKAAGDLEKPTRLKKIPSNKEEASKVIQRAWRRHIDVQVFKYYRDLINFRQRGDPSLMLRCINPNEAKLMDAAMGIHIKFRLAGERFPPNIYYKIFTHRPIQDLCANSPKDYTRVNTKRLAARSVHNKGEGQIKAKLPGKDCVGWYQRLENNGWRLVSDRLINHAFSDPVTWETSIKKTEFVHDKLKRRQDVEKKKKKRKIDWMQKMYKQGMLQAKVDDRETIDLIEGAAAGMFATVDSQGPEAIAEWEVDELLDWTTSLNFDEYLSGWRQLATSAPSEGPAEERLKLLTADPYELNFGNVYQKAENTTQPQPEICDFMQSNLVVIY